ncbi:MAG TPA: hypothetical protein VFP01_11265 [Propionibacteriaceae bacterium]|nr:hypothetical protein [Propionibacteriaceae bacterium]
MPSLPECDPELFTRVALLFRLEALINIGLKYGPDDLEASTWDHLLILASERAFVDRILDGRRDKHRQDDQMMQRARSASGTPAPGGTLFKPTRPFKGPTR